MSPVDPNPNSDGRNQSAGQADSPAHAARSEPHQPQPIPEQYNPKKEEKHWLEYATFIAAVLAGIGAVVAANFSGWQGVIASRTYKVVKDQENRQLQAYVGLLANTMTVDCSQCDSPPATPTAESTVNKVNFRVKNFGQTPAYRPTSCIDAFPESYGAGVSNTEIGELFSDCEPILDQTSHPTIWPGETRDWFIPMLKTNFPLFKEAREHKRSLIIAGKIVYRDVFNAIHHSYVCFVYINDNEFLACNGVILQDD